MSYEMDPGLRQILDEHAANLKQHAEHDFNEWKASGEPVPDLEYRYPDCSICQNEVEGDGDSLWCEYCGIHWSIDGSGGEVVDE